MLYGQRSDKWKDIKLGFSNDTIGNSGCLLCSFANIAYDCGKDTDPIKLNQIFKDKGLYMSDCLLTDHAVNDAFPDVKYIGTKWYLTYPADLKYIREKLREGKIILAGIDFYPATAKEDWHFIRIIEEVGSDFKIDDPWYAEQNQLLSKYYGGAGRAIMKIMIYEGNISSDVCISKEVFEKLVTEGTAYNNFVNIGIKSIADIDKLKQDIKDRNSYIEGQNAEIEQYKNHQLEIAKKLGVENDPPKIIGEIVKLAGVEVENIKLQKLLDGAEKVMQELNNELVDAKERYSLLEKEEKGLRQQLDVSQAVVLEQKTQVDRLEKNEEILEEKIRLLKLTRKGLIGQFKVWRLLIKVFDLWKT